MEALTQFMEKLYKPLEFTIILQVLFFIIFFIEELKECRKLNYARYKHLVFYTGEYVIAIGGIGKSPKALKLCERYSIKNDN